MITEQYVEAILRVAEGDVSIARVLREICALTADCERNTFCPAREKLPSLATSRNVTS